MRLAIIFAFVALFGSTVLAQKAPLKFGKVDQVDMDMTVYPKDTSAPAVILYDYGYFDDEQFKFTRLKRIKILTKEGYQYANHKLHTAYKANVRGITYNLINGEIVETRLEKSNIFVEKETEEDNIVRVAMPDVRVGSVIDLEYTFPGIPFEWAFQDHIPVMWSELIIERSPYIKFQQNFYGPENLYIYEANRWVGKDMPAVKEEPFISSFNNCVTKFEFDISEVTFPGYFASMYAKSWETVSSVLFDYKYFGEPLMASMYLNNCVKEIKNNNGSRYEKMIMAFDHVKAIRWNGESSLSVSEPDLSSVYKNRTGNSADINLILYSLLKKLDFEVYPVVMSTRENGVLSPIYPSLNKLNYVIVLVKLDGENHLLDATDRFLPCDMLPFRALNYQGRALDVDNSFWVDLEPVKKVRETVLFDLTMDEEMNFSGKINYSRSDYAAYNFRTDYHSFNSDQEYLNDYISERPGLQVTGFKIDNLDSLDLPVKDEYIVKIKNRVDVIGDEAYLYPMFYEGYKENPFKVEERKFPVDFGYGFEKSFVFHIVLPGSMTVTGIPKPVSVKLPDSGGSFLYQVSVTGGNVHVVCKFNLNKTFFKVEEYPALRQFFDEMIKKRNEPIVVKIG